MVDEGVGVCEAVAVGEGVREDETVGDPVPVGVKVGVFEAVMVAVGESV